MSMANVKILRSAINRLRGAIGSVYKDWRGETDRAHMALLRASRTWPRSALKAYQWRQLKILVAHAWYTVPFYRQRMAAAGVSPHDIRSEQDFQRLPVLDRSSIYDNAERMVSDCYPRCRLERRTSAGSTGEPVAVYLDPRRLRLSVTEEIWADGWSGWRPGEPVAMVWGDESGAVGAGGFRRWVRGHIHSPGFIVDARSLSREGFLEFADKYRKWRPGLVVAYASALRPLAEFLLEEAVHPAAPHAVISSAELLAESTRQLAQRAFGAPVLDRYGCRETGLVAFQCGPAGHYHVNMLRIYLEVVSEDGRPVEPGQPGKVLLTDLGSFAMPLIRYQVGDMAAWAAYRRCPCGTGAECLERIEGRTSDFVRSPLGHRVHRAKFNALILGTPGIRQYRLVQESLREVRLEIVESRPLAPDLLRGLCEQVRSVIGGEVEVRIGRVSRLPQTAAGKYRYVESRVPDGPAPAMEK